jgi:very-short-patch-repair endonuclease
MRQVEAPSRGQQVHRIARMLRRNSTRPEKKLWDRVRAGQLDGFRFRRQFPIGEFIVDFCCRERRLVIELDGSQHADAARMAQDRAHPSDFSSREPRHSLLERRYLENP